MTFTGKATYSAGTDLPELAEDVSDIIGIVSPHETPLLDFLGDPRRVATNTIHEWIEDSLIPNTDKIDQSSFSPDALSDTTIKVDNAGRFRIGDLVQPAGTGEVWLVTDIITDTLTVVRGYGGTTAASVTNNQDLHILGNAALEGEDAAAARFTSRVRKQNYTQIFTETIRVSGTMQAARQHGIDDEADYQKAERLREMLRDLENTVINGVAAASNPQGSSTVRRTMNGIVQSISTNVLTPGTGTIPDGGGTSQDVLTEEVLNAALRTVWESSSGSVDTLVMNATQKRALNDFILTERRYAPDDETMKNVVSVYESDFGVCRVVMTRWAPADTVLLLDSSRVSVMPMAGRSFFYQPLGATGDAINGQLIGEYTLEFRNENAHAVLSGLSTTGD